MCKGFVSSYFPIFAVSFYFEYSHFNVYKMLISLWFLAQKLEDS